MGIAPQVFQSPNQIGRMLMQSEYRHSTNLCKAKFLPLWSSLSRNGLRSASLWTHLHAYHHIRDLCAEYASLVSHLVGVRLETHCIRKLRSTETASSIGLLRPVHPSSKRMDRISSGRISSRLERQRRRALDGTLLVLPIIAAPNLHETRSKLLLTLPFPRR